MPQSAIRHIFYSIRPSACAGVALFATAGLGRWNDWFLTSLAFTASFIGAAGCFLINDVFDREKDLQNKKNRPVATGELSVGLATGVAIGCCLFLITASWLVSWPTFYTAVVLVTCFWLYSYVNQHFGLIANLWVSACSALAFFGGTTVYGMTDWVLMAMVTTFFVNAGREMLLDVLDQTGDRAVGKPSFPIKYGERVTFLMVVFLNIVGSLAGAYFLVMRLDQWIGLLLLLATIWIPFFKNTKDFRAWALFNVRSSHLFFVILIVLLFLRPQ